MNRGYWLRVLPQVYAAEMGILFRVHGSKFHEKFPSCQMNKTWMACYFSELRDHGYLGSAMWPEISQKRSASPAGYINGKATQRSSEDHADRLNHRPCLVPSWCGARITTVYEMAADREIFRDPLGLLPLRSQKKCVYKNECMRSFTFKISSLFPLHSFRRTIHCGKFLRSYLGIISPTGAW